MASSVKSSHLLINLVLICLFLQAVNACLKEHFEIVQFKYHPGPVQERLPGATMEACRRVCRLTKDCYHFNMFWPIGGSTGTCAILSSNDTGRTDILVAENTASYFWSCPEEMTFVYSMKKCYKVITELMAYPEATTYCSHNFPGAHLVDFESDEEQSAVNSLVEATDPVVSRYFTSGMNTNPSSTAKDPADFKWLSTGQVINYTNWYPGKPDRRGADQICIISKRSHGWQWNDSLCDIPKMFVCEMC